MRRRFVVAAALVVCRVAIAAPPVIESFTATPLTLEEGQSSILRWDVTGATELRIDPQVGPVFGATGEIGLPALHQDRELTLTAANADGEVTASVGPIHIVIDTVPNIRLASVAAIRYEPFLVEIDCPGCTTLEVTPGPGVIEPVLDANAFELTAANDVTVTATATIDGQLVTRQRVFELDQRTPESSITATPDDPFGGRDVVLRIETRYTPDVLVEPGVGTASVGVTEFVVQPVERTVYGLVDPGAPQIPIETVVVTPRAPEAELTVPASAFSGVPIALTVEVEGADTVFLEPGVGAIPGTGTYQAQFDVTTDVTLRAENPTGTTIVTRTVHVVPPRIQDFRPLPDVVFAGDTPVLRWAVDGAETIDLLVEGQVGLANVRSFGVEPLAAIHDDVTVELRATSVAGTSTRSHTIHVVPIRIFDFETERTVVAPGESVRLSWTAAGDGEVHLDGFGVQPAEGSLDVPVTRSRTFHLEALDHDGTVVDSHAIAISAVGAGTTSGRFRWSWSATGTDDDPPVVQPNVPFTAWVVSEDVPHDITAFEFRAILPPELLVLGSEITVGAGPIDFGTLPEWWVGLGSCVPAAPTLPLVRVEMLALGDLDDRFLSLRGIDDPSVPTGLPAMADCTIEVKTVDVGVPLALNAPPVASVDLTAIDGGDGVRLHWAAPDVGCAERVHVFRVPAAASPVYVAALTGSNACGTWTDGGAPGNLSDLRYRVIVETTTSLLESDDVDVALLVSAPSTARTRLLRNVPNPFNPSTELCFELARAAEVSIDVFDVAGRRVRHIEMPRQAAGPGAIVWDGTDDRGEALASGAYLIRMVADGVVDTGRVVLLK